MDKIKRSEHFASEQSESDNQGEDSNDSESIFKEHGVEEQKFDRPEVATAKKR